MRIIFFFVESRISNLGLMQLKYFLYIDNVASMLQLFKKKFFYFYFYSALSQEGITYLSTELRTISFRVKSRKLNVNKRVWICVNRREARAGENRFYRVSRRESKRSNWFSSQPAVAISKPVRSSSLKLTCVESGISERQSGIGGDTLLGGVSYKVEGQLIDGAPLLCASFVTIVFPDVNFFDPRIRWDMLARRFDFLPSSILSKSNFQKPPFPGSSFERGNLTKHLFNDRLCRIEFCSK